MKEDHDDLISNKHLYQDALNLEKLAKEDLWGKSAETRILEAIDMISKPPHYTNPDGFPEVIEILMYWFPDQPLLWQVGKYLARWNRKDTPLENLKKARYYLNRKIKELDPKDLG